MTGYDPARVMEERKRMASVEKSVLEPLRERAREQLSELVEQAKALGAGYDRFALQLAHSAWIHALGGQWDQITERNIHGRA